MNCLEVGLDRLRTQGWVLSIAFLLSILAASVLRADDQAYFINGGQFGTIDLDTGTTVILGTNVNLGAFTAGLGEIGGTLYTAAQNGGTLYSVNPKSGALNPIGPYPSDQSRFRRERLSSELG